MADALAMARANLDARAAILAGGVDMFQQIYSTGINPASQTVVDVPVRNVGLVRGFLVKVQATISNSSGSTALTRTEFGAANLLSHVSFTDLNNQVRIQTTGWHLALINSAKQQMTFGGAYSPNIPVNFGNNWDVMSAPSSIAASGSTPVQFYYYVPLAYTRDDLRGAMFAGVVNATSNLQLTLNSAPVAASGDATAAIYSGAAGTMSNVTITVFQDYIDQLPTSGGSVILPAQDLSVIYELKNTALTGLAVGQEFAVPYSNFRSFLSTTAVFNNGGTLGVGADVNYWAMQAANTTQLFRYDAETAALLARSVFMADPPKGTYYFDHRRKPINTQQFGNMQLVLNPATVNSGAAVLVGFEDFTTTNIVGAASSLPSAGN